MCNKRPFASHDAAARALKTWRIRSRRSAFDKAHVYLCDECVNTYHVGRTHEKRMKTTTPHEMPMIEPDELDEIFDAQTRRIKGRLRTAINRVERRRQRRLRNEDGPTVTHNSLVEDQFDVETR